MLNLPIHHIGVATRSIEREWLVFEKLGFIKEAGFVDTTQGVRGEFIIPRNPHLPSYRFELLENLGQKGVLDSYLANNTKMYHIAYESRDIQADLDSLLANDFAHTPNNNAKQANSTMASKQDSTGGGMNKYLSSKARLIVPIMEASYFAKLCFVMLPNRLLIELVELKGK